MTDKFNINIQSKIKTSFEGPSSSYYQAKTRFDEILRTKLGVESKSTGMLNGANASNLYGSGVPTSIEAVYSDVRLSSGVTGDQIDAKLKGTGMEGLGNAFVQAEQKYGVNAWFLTSLAIHESAYGTSKIAQEKNNLFGFQAYDHAPFENAATFNSKEASIDHVAKYLSEAYLTPGGTYYNGVSIDGIGRRYATDPQWANKVKSHMANLLIA